jgi:drug/metabolite transporter (DMT)-like permease
MLRTSLFGVLVVVQGIFGLWPVLVKSALDTGDKATAISLYRDTLASAILWICVWVECDRPNIVGAIKTLVKTENGVLSKYSFFLWLGLASCINSLGFVLSLNYITPFNSALLHPGIPVFAVVLGSYVGVEAYSQKKMMGALICISGSILVVVSQSDLELSYSIIGNFLLVAQSVAMACLLVGQKFVKDEFSSLRVTALYYSVGTLLSVPSCLIMATIDEESVLIGSSTSWLVIIFGAVFVVCFNYAALTWATRVSSPAIPSSSMMLQPLITYLISYMWGYKQSLGIWDAVGGGFIILGLVMTVFSDTKLLAFLPESSGYQIVKGSDDDHEGSHGGAYSGAYTDDEMELMMRTSNFTGVSGGSDAFQI